MLNLMTITNFPMVKSLKLQPTSAMPTKLKNPVKHQRHLVMHSQHHHPMNFAHNISVVNHHFVLASSLLIHQFIVKHVKMQFKVQPIHNKKLVKLQVFMHQGVVKNLFPLQFQRLALNALSVNKRLMLVMKLQ